MLFRFFIQSSIHGGQYTNETYVAYSSYYVYVLNINPMYWSFSLFSSALNYDTITLDSGDVHWDAWCSCYWAQSNPLKDMKRI